MIQITNRYQIEETTHFEMTSEKKTAQICHNPSLGYVRVLCVNASSRCRRFSLGRTFWSWEDALAAYKSAEMKAMIEVAREEIERPVTDADWHNAQWGQNAL